LINKWTDVNAQCTNAVGAGRWQEVASKEVLSPTLDDELKFINNMD
jgi:hypothetical protein